MRGILGRFKIGIRKKSVHEMFFFVCQQYTYIEYEQKGTTKSC